MESGCWRTGAAGANLLAVVFAGYAAGRWLWATDCSLVTSLASLASIGLAFVAIVRGTRPTAPIAADRVGGRLLIAYVVPTAGAGCFAWVGDDAAAVAVGAVWLAPPAVGALLLPRLGGWASGLGCVAVLFAGTASLTYSAMHDGSGVGLFFAWLG